MKIKAESRCGLLCSECTFRQPCGCPGCHAADGKMFFGECPVSVCCRDKNHDHCGECSDFPCELLVSFSCDPEHGDSPQGKRIEQCREWTRFG